MKPKTCTAAEVASVLRLTVDEFHDVIKKHRDFPAANHEGDYSRAEVFAYLDRKFKQGKMGTLMRRTGAGSLN
jgi:hypothetical protein